MKRALGISAVLLLVGCSAYSSKPTTTVLPTSNRSIDVVLHRSDVRFTDCGTLTVLQTYSAVGELIDAKEARGQALHCAVLPALIDAGGRVGAASVVRPAITKISNSVNQAQGQGQAQGQIQGQGQGTTVVLPESTQVNDDSHGHGHGNNGQGNGNGDGTNPGTGHHHDNGDNN